MSDQQASATQAEPAQLERLPARKPRPRKPAEGWRCPVCGDCEWLIPSKGWPCPGCFEAESS